MAGARALFRGRSIRENSVGDAGAAALLAALPASNLTTLRSGALGSRVVGRIRANRRAAPGRSRLEGNAIAPALLAAIAAALRANEVKVAPAPVAVAGGGGAGSPGPGGEDAAGDGDDDDGGLVGGFF